MFCLLLVVNNKSTVSIFYYFIDIYILNFAINPFGSNELKNESACVIKKLNTEFTFPKIVDDEYIT